MSRRSGSHQPSGSRRASGNSLTSCPADQIFTPGFARRITARARSSAKASSAFRISSTSAADSALRFSKWSRQIAPTLFSIFVSTNGMADAPVQRSLWPTETRAQAPRGAPLCRCLVGWLSLKIEPSRRAERRDAKRPDAGGRCSEHQICRDAHMIITWTGARYPFARPLPRLATTFAARGPVIPKNSLICS